MFVNHFYQKLRINTILYFIIKSFNSSKRTSDAPLLNILDPILKKEDFVNYSIVKDFIHFVVSKAYLIKCL